MNKTENAAAVEKGIEQSNAVWENAVPELLRIERERCAKIAEEYGGHSSKFEYACISNEIARRIRAIR